MMCVLLHAFICLICTKYGPFMCIFTHFTLKFTLFLLWALCVYFQVISRQNGSKLVCLRCFVHHRKHAWGPWAWLCCYLCWTKAYKTWNHQIHPNDIPHSGEWEWFTCLLSASKAFVQIHCIFGRIEGHSTQCYHIRSNEGKHHYFNEFWEIPYWGRIRQIGPSKKGIRSKIWPNGTLYSIK